MFYGQLSKSRSNHQTMVHTDLIADQADGDHHERGFNVGQTTNSQYTDNLTNELQQQRKEVKYKMSILRQCLTIV